MNDLNMLQDLGAARDPATGEPPPGLRHRVLHGFDGPAPRRRRRWRLSPGWSLATSAGLVAVLAVALIAGGPDGSGPSGRRTEGVLTASDLLLRAAQNMRADTTPPPRPDQFVYVQSISAYPTNPARIRPVQPKMRQLWLSADGTHDGLLRESAMPGGPPASDIIAEAPLPGCRNGKAAVVDQHWKVHPDQLQDCSVDPAYRADVPTNAADMLRYLRGKANDHSDAAKFLEIRVVIREKYLTPGQLAAVFEAASHLSGVVVVPDVVDVAGRRGVAVALSVPASDPTGASPPAKASIWQQQLIFDPTTYAYLGYQTVAVADVDGHKRGDLLGGSAALQNAIVDRAGQVP
ncbi:CU044_5270 family protein [Dactylosporangium sp. NPDC051485]|uniref:CU044_5270 family protein n=1 Tax=Dactylosporangium sp. NPDC051485 TaxID=3154846 RepID=UPI0034141602